MDNPEEHFLWALVHLPNVGGVATVTHPDILKAWSKHLYEAGFRHDPEKQQKKLLRAYRGPQHQYNGATKWVGMDVPEPEKVVIPDIRTLTAEENAAMLAQYRAAGMIPAPPPEPDKASVE